MVSFFSSFNKSVFFVLLIFPILLFPLVSSGQSIHVTDIVGRKVTLDAPAQNVILGEGRALITLSLLSDNPVELVAGWTGDFRNSGGLLFDEYLNRFPEMAEIPVIGFGGRETVSTERIISLKPDLAIFGSGSHGPNARSADVIRQLEAAGIPIIFIDFRIHPFTNTVPSLEILGKVLGEEERVDAYIALYQKKWNRIRDRLAGENPNRPGVYMEMIRGDLVGSPGSGNLGEFIEFANGRNLGDILPGEVGTLNMEYVITQNPDRYIITGIARPGEPGLEIGFGIHEDQARESLKKIASRPVVSGFPAVENSNVFGLWHLFYDSPLNILAAESLAKWIHPELFEDIDPAKTLQDINDRFLAVPFTGTYFLSIDE